MTSGSCSSATTGDNNKVTITCTGLTGDQVKTLSGIPSLLNKILQRQEDETGEIMSRLNDCVEGVKQARRGIYSGYDYNGAKRDQRPGVSSVTEGPEVAAFQHLVELGKQQHWKELVEESEDQIKKTPNWLTPYLFSGIGNLSLGNRDAAIKRLEYVKSEAAGNPDYAEAARILTQLGEN
ncbi:MAG: hypothetical protein WBV26_02175 [Candidatus Sulfotelmatobacter sp.]